MWRMKENTIILSKYNSLFIFNVLGERQGEDRWLVPHWAQASPERHSHQ